MSDVVVFVRVNTAPPAALSGLIRGIVIAAPLKIHRNRRTEIDLHRVGGDRVVMKAAREDVAAR